MIPLPVVCDEYVLAKIFQCFQVFLSVRTIRSANKKYYVTVAFLISSKGRLRLGCKPGKVCDSSVLVQFAPEQCSATFRWLSFSWTRTSPVSRMFSLPTVGCTFINLNFPPTASVLTISSFVHDCMVSSHEQKLRIQ